MRKFHLLALLVVGVAGIGLQGEAAPTDTEASFAPGEVLVRFHSGVAAQRISDVEEAYDLRLIDEIAHLSVRHYAIPADSSVPTIVDLLSALPEVEYAEPNHTYDLQGLPAEPRINEQWALHNTGQTVNGRAGPADIDIDWPEAMDLFTGRGTPVVAVIDSGVAPDHPDLLPNIWSNPGEGADPNGIDDDHNGYIDDGIGWDFYDDDPLPLDEAGHGTFVASVIASAWNGVGISGVAPIAKIMALRILGGTGNGPTAPTDRFVKATTYAASMGARIINFSAGHPDFSATERAQVQWLDAQGVLLVAAAGNGGSDAKGDNIDFTPNFPASYSTPNIISVAALNRVNALADFSNYGATSVDLAAPGVDILGAYMARTTSFIETFESGANGWIADGFCSPHGSGSPFVDALGNTRASDSNYFGSANFHSPFADCWLDSPPLLLSPDGPPLEFLVWNDLEPLFDSIGVEVSIDGLDWFPLESIFGVSSMFPPGTSFDPGGKKSADLSQYAGQAVQLRFHLRADGVSQGDGAYIDNVAIVASDGAGYRFDKGTSFSAPLVSGTAALLLAQRPSLTHHQLRALILENVDAVGSLNGRVSTGGRLNARNAVQAAIDMPEPSTTLQGLVGVVAIVALRRRFISKRIEARSSQPDGPVPIRAGVGLRKPKGLIDTFVFHLLTLGVPRASRAIRERRKKGGARDRI